MKPIFFAFFLFTGFQLYSQYKNMLNEEFDNNKNQWPVFFKSNGTADVSKFGTYLLKCDSGTLRLGIPMEINTSKGFILEATLGLLAPPNKKWEMSYGIILWNKDGGNEIALLLNAQKEFIAFNRVDYNSQMKEKPRGGKYKIDYDNFVKLKIQLDDDVFKYFVNDKEVFFVSNKYGMIGLDHIGFFLTKNIEMTIENIIFKGELLKK